MEDNWAFWGCLEMYLFEWKSEEGKLGILRFRLLSFIGSFAPDNMTERLGFLSRF